MVGGLTIVKLPVAVSDTAWMLTGDSAVLVTVKTSELVLSQRTSP